MPTNPPPRPRWARRSDTRKSVAGTTRFPLLCAASAALWVSCPVGASGAADPPRKILAGRVTAVRDGSKTFDLESGIRKKLVTITSDKKTAWTWAHRKDHRLRVNDRVYVEAAPVKEPTYRAALVRVLDPNEKPSVGKTTPN